jgi:hypothetical protein
MEFEAKCIAKSTHAIRNGANMSCPDSSLRWFSSAFVVQKNHHTKPFLEKSIGQECPAKIQLGRFDWKSASGKIGFCDCRLRKTTIGQICPT